MSNIKIHLDEIINNLKKIIKNAKITFIIPSINRPSLPRTIDSLIRQKNPNWKAIIIFDGVKSNIKIADNRFSIININKIDWIFWGLIIAGCCVILIIITVILWKYIFPTKEKLGVTGNVRKNRELYKKYEQDDKNTKVRSEDLKMLYRVAGGIRKNGNGDNSNLKSKPFGSRVVKEDFIKNDIDLDYNIDFDSIGELSITSERLNTTNNNSNKSNSNDLMYQTKRANAAKLEVLGSLRMKMDRHVMKLETDTNTDDSAVRNNDILFHSPSGDLESGSNFSSISPNNAFDNGVNSAAELYKKLQAKANAKKFILPPSRRNNNNSYSNYNNNNNNNNNKIQDHVRKRHERMKDGIKNRLLNKAQVLQKANIDDHPQWLKDHHDDHDDHNYNTNSIKNNNDSRFYNNPMINKNNKKKTDTELWKESHPAWLHDNDNDGNNKDNHPNWLSSYDDV